ncbi:MAG: ribonuclease P protein component [Candidatus Dadabacteria bacterium]|nr:ribonuclease P protein component [Candidatus Dadabacteria bacterium]NIS09369.1 ribonuclease P protein component [Candidatus Dadabacteria bacterium]NIV42379.1 ribonuclease P protein component [Candidatus Dadabacteria bacterium]NIX15905.1 ribonuclease P protein component [Candidatus Dadabacteria bacterium]NIY22612.1 ribonuclease P protein component [Candidatus Dadabacteria bacterium]
MRTVSSETFPKYLRIRSPLDFKRLFACGSRSNLEFVRVISLDNNLGYPRLGIVASKRNLPKAVMRSKFKRAIREVFRKHKEYLGNKDYLVINLRKTNDKGQVYRARDFENYIKGN